MHPLVIGGLIAFAAKCLMDADREYQGQVRNEYGLRSRYEQARASRAARRAVIGLLIEARKSSSLKRQEFFANIEQLRGAARKLRDYLRAERPKGEERVETERALDQCEAAIDLYYARTQREKDFSSEITEQLDWIHAGGEPRAWSVSAFLPEAPSSDIPDAFPIVGRLTTGQVVSAGASWQICIHGRYRGGPVKDEPGWTVSLGQWLDVLVDGIHYKNGEVWVSHARANLIRASAGGGVVTGVATERNSGGYVFEVERARVFVPRSLAGARPVDRGEECNLRVIENDRRWRRVIGQLA